MSPWVRLDDDFDDDPRIATAGPSAAGLLAMLLAYSNRNLCDGFVSANTVRQKAAALGDAGAVIAVMTKVGLLQPIERDGIAGFQIHGDFVRLQPTREQVEAERQARKLRKERWRERHRNADWNTDGTLSGTETGHRSEDDRNGDGTHRPVPVPVPDPDPDERETQGVRKGWGAGEGEPGKRRAISITEMQSRLMEAGRRAGAK